MSGTEAACRQCDREDCALNRAIAIGNADLLQSWTDMADECRAFASGGWKRRALAMAPVVSAAEARLAYMLNDRAGEAEDIATFDALRSTIDAYRARGK